MLPVFEALYAKQLLRRDLHATGRATPVDHLGDAGPALFTDAVVTTNDHFGNFCDDFVSTCENLRALFFELSKTAVRLLVFFLEHRFELAELFFVLRHGRSDFVDGFGKLERFIFAVLEGAFDRLNLTTSRVGLACVGGLCGLAPGSGQRLLALFDLGLLLFLKPACPFEVRPLTVEQRLKFLDISAHVAKSIGDLR